jgi:hypothetical protein
MIKIITFIIISSALNGLNFVIFMTHQDYESANVFIFLIVFFLSLILTSILFPPFVYLRKNYGLPVFFGGSITAGALTSLIVKNLITGFYIEFGILDFYYMAFGSSAGLCACVIFIFCERNIKISW